MTDDYQPEPSLRFPHWPRMIMKDNMQPVLTCVRISAGVKLIRIDVQ